MVPPDAESQAPEGPGDATLAPWRLAGAGEAEDEEPSLPETPGGSSADRVVRFLQDIRGLGVLSSEDLESLIYANRFDLLPRPKSGEGGASPGPWVRDGSKLPPLEEIPSQEEMHDVLMKGLIPRSHQCVAHVLYPDQVPWPSEGTIRFFESELPLSEAPWKSEDATMPPGTAAADTGRVDTVGSSAVGSAQQEMSVSDDDGQQLVRHRISMETQPDVSNAQKEHSSGFEIVLCGRKVKTTALGRRPPPQFDGRPSPEEEEAEREFKAARIRRQKAEHAAKMDSYSEKKLLDRIQCLEAMKQAELEHQAAVEKREAQRLARREELRKQQQADVQRKMEEEKAQEEAEAEQKKKDAAAEKRAKRYHEQQRERLEQWYAEGCDEDVPRTVQAKLRYAELQEKKKAKEKIKQGQQKTAEQLESMQKFHRLQMAIEERPPQMPQQPKAHDLPRRGVESVDGSWDGHSSARSSSLSARGPPVPGGWTVQARFVSHMYGLSEKDRNAVHEHFARGVRGAGRMATYERSGLPPSARVVSLSK